MSLTSKEVLILQEHLHDHDIALGMISPNITRTQNATLRALLVLQQQVLRTHVNIMMQFLKRGMGPSATGLSALVHQALGSPPHNRVRLIAK